MLMRFGKKTAFATVTAIATTIVAAVAAMVGQGGAFAQGGATFPLFSAAGGAVGLGSISPGLPTSGCANQVVTFDSAVLVYADTTPAVVTANTHFSGNSSICETLNAGQGSGTLSGGLSGTVDYTRTGNVVTLGGTINGHAGAGACLFVPTSVNPVTSYWLSCVFSAPGDSVIPTVTPTPLPTVSPTPVPTPTVPTGPLPPCTTAAGVVACASLTPTTTQGTYGVNGLSSAPGPVAGSVDTYKFTLPNGGTVTLPCVVLVSGSTTVDPCAAAGGTYVATLETLSTASTPVAAVRICNADLVLTVDGIGINSFPAFVVC